MQSPRAGVVCWGRLRLERPLPGDPENHLWLATDQRTSGQCAVEFLPQGVTGSANPVHLPHASLLSFYRFESSDSTVAAVSAFHPLLDSPPLSRPPAQAVAPALALEWITSVADAVQSLHDGGYRAHGAIVPSRIRARSNHVLLTGYPYAVNTELAGEKAFLSPQCRDGKADPEIPDDVYGLAAFAYFLLTGGGAPMRGAGINAGEPGIDTIRVQQGRAPTGWALGWDNSLRAALSDLPSLRPASARSLIETLSKAVGRPRDRSVSKVRPFVPRGNPAWRFATSHRGPRNGESGTTHPPPAAGGQNRGEIRAEKEQLRQWSGELDRRRDMLARDLIQIEKSRAQSVSETAEIRTERTALHQAQAELKVATEQLTHERRVFEAERTEFALTKLERLAKREEELACRTKELLQLEKEAELRRHSLQTQEAAVQARASTLLSNEQTLAIRTREFESREAAFRSIQQAWTELCGSDKPEAWKTFVARHGAAATPSESKSAAAAGRNSDFSAISSTVTNPPLVLTGPRSVILAFPNGRRLHVYSGRIIRFGRHAESDYLLVAMLRGQHQPNLALLREISRRHFELHVSETGARIEDGWSDEQKPSQHGVCIDGRRVPAVGAELRHGALLSITTRAPTRTVPHWKVIWLHGTSSAPANSPRDVDGKGSSTLHPALSAVSLRRLDDAPGDVCVLLESIRLRDIGYVDAAFGDAVLAVSASGITWTVDDNRVLLQEGLIPQAGVTVVPPT